MLLVEPCDHLALVVVGRAGSRNDLVGPLTFAPVARVKRFKRAGQRGVGWEHCDMPLYNMGRAIMNFMSLVEDCRRSWISWG
jgi:hypothetical protein